MVGIEAMKAAEEGMGEEPSDPDLLRDHESLG